MVSQIFCFVVLDLTLVFQILLVANKDAGDVLIGVLVDFAHPFRDFGERIAVSNVISDDDTVCSTVVAGRDGLEAILASGIPNLELDSLAVNLDSTDLEIDADRRHEVLVEDVVCETQQ